MDLSLLVPSKAVTEQRTKPQQDLLEPKEKSHLHTNILMDVYVRNHTLHCKSLDSEILDHQ